ncbi:MAG: formate dehydrogenase beta subunit [Pseudomonadales bacterium]
MSDSEATAVKLYIPGDASALSVGADAVAQAIAAEAGKRVVEIELVRNGSRGMSWLEPLVEVETGEGRVAYGPVAEQDVQELFESGLLQGSEQHPLYHGRTEDIPYFKAQQRLTFARCGVIDPLSLIDYQNHDGFTGLRRALSMSQQEIVDEVKTSGLRGRGGAAFPTGIKWQTVLDATGKTSDHKYIACNADEGDSGTFADRMLMEGDPFTLIEGMIVAGLGVGATQGYIYLRSEYPHAQKMLQSAIEIAYDAGYLGSNISGSGKCFELELRMGAGAYICGEETSMLESLEGKRGMVRFKPPLPALEGLFGQPTVVNNVISLASVPVIFSKGADHYKNFGLGRSLGTLTIQLAGNVLHGGLVELGFGITLRELMENFGAGTSSGKPARAVQVGGPLGAYLPESQWDTPLDYEAFAAIDAMLGHGGVVVFDDSVDMAQQAQFAMQFCAIESCGKCTPCRIGSVRGVETIEKIRRNDNRQANLIVLEDLCDTMIDGSLCAMGGLTPIPVRSALQHFPQDFDGEAVKVEVNTNA